jgi:MFS family permease
MSLPILGDALAPLAHRGFRIAWTARIISGLGSWIAPIAVAFAVLDLHGSAADVGIVLAARTIPFLGFMLLGGVMADRQPRNRVLVWSSVVAGSSQALAATLLLTSSAEIWHLIVIEAINGAGAAFAGPAGFGLVPLLVPKEQLRQANALGGTTATGVRIMGTAIGGVIVAAFGSGIGLAIDAATFVVAALLYRAIGLSNEARVKASNLWTDMVDGWREFIARRWVWLITFGFIVLNMSVGGLWYTLGPVVADQSIGRGWWGGVLAAQSVGLLTATILMARFKPGRPMFMGLIGSFVYVPLYAILALAPVLPLLLPAAFGIGLAIGLFNVAWYTALQTHIPEERLSRVVSHDTFWSFAAIPLGQIGAGYLAAQFGIGPVLLAGAAVCGIVTLGMLLSADVRRADRVPLPKPADRVAS